MLPTAQVPSTPATACRTGDTRSLAETRISMSTAATSTCSPGVTGNPAALSRPAMSRVDVGNPATMSASSASTGEGCCCAADSVVSSNATAIVARPATAKRCGVFEPCSRS